MRRKFSLVLLFAILLSLFQSQVSSAQPGTVFYSHSPYQFTAPVKLNSFLSDGFPGQLGIYADLVEPPLAYFLWASDHDYHGLLAESWGFEGEGGSRFVVKLRQDAMWSDGSTVTARDLVVTYLLGRLRSVQDYRYVSEVTARDEHTVVFTLKRPTLIVERLILKTRVRPSSVYGDIADKVQALLDMEGNLAQADTGELQQTDEWKVLQAELTDFRPAQVVGSGAYTLDAADITNEQVTLRRSAVTVFKPTFDSIVLYRGNVDRVIARVEAGELTYSADQYSPDLEPTLEAAGYTLLRTPTYSGTAIYFNHGRYTLGKVEVRQAIAYLLNRPQIAAVALGDSALPLKLISGLNEDRAPYYIDGTDVKLNPYDQDVDKAEALLTGIGFSRGRRGWIDDQGEPFTLRLSFAGEVPRYPQAAAEIARQLTDFGIETQVNGVVSTQLLRDVVDGRFDLLLYSYGVIGNPFPYNTYRNTFYSLNEPGLSQGKKGIAFPMVQVVNGQEVDLAALIAQLEDETEDGNSVSDIVEQIAVVYNEQLPILPLYDRYTNTPLLAGSLSGVPSSDDPIYKNAYSADNYVMLWLLEGVIAPR